MFASIVYPLFLVFASDMARYWLIVLALLFFANVFLQAKGDRIFSVFAGIFFALSAFFYDIGLKYLYPIIVSFVFLGMFLFSLKNEAFITRLARLKEPNLDKKVVIYTRNLTKIWCIFFALNAFIAFYLMLLDDKRLWAIYTGVISYILMGALFFGEMIFRKFVLRVK